MLLRGQFAGKQIAGDSVSPMPSPSKAKNKMKRRSKAKSSVLNKVDVPNNIVLEGTTESSQPPDGTDPAIGNAEPGRGGTEPQDEPAASQREDDIGS